jgi:hypothetical protein
MIIMDIISQPIDSPQGLEILAKEIGGYFIKVVIDIEKEILSAGAKMHIDEEAQLLSMGSSQSNLWGGGYDLETKEITHDSIINNKPGVNNSSEILGTEIRVKVV